MKEQIIFYLPGISLQELQTHDEEEPIAFNDLKPLSLNVIDNSSSYDISKEKQTYLIQRGEILLEKNVKDILIQYQYCNETREWPKATKYHCFWCCHSFNTMPCFIPISFKDNIYKVLGNFCSFNCALSFNYNSNYVNYGEKSSLIQDLYYKIYGFNAPQLKYAPSKEVLEMFGGSITIEQYRESFQTINDYKITFPNIVFVIPQLLEEKQMNLYKQQVIDLPKLPQIKPITKVNTSNSLVVSMGIQKK